MDTQDQMPVGGFHQEPELGNAQVEPAQPLEQLSVDSELAILAIWLVCGCIYWLYFLLWREGLFDGILNFYSLSGVGALLLALAPGAGAYLWTKRILENAQSEEESP